MSVHAQHLFEVDEDSWRQHLTPAELSALIAGGQDQFSALAAAVPVQQTAAAAGWSGARLGLHMAVENTYPVTEFITWGLQETFECWANEEFIREHSRDVPEDRVRSQARSASIIVPATRYTRIDRRALALEGALSAA